jgi:DNA-binding NtrC family response regulator
MTAKLLIVESDDLFRQNLARSFTSAGLKVYPADFAQQAEEIIRQRDCDVVLIGLPGLGREGLHLLRNVKEMRPFTEVILITGNEQLALSIEGMKLGAFDDFRIPLDMKLLLDRVHEAYRTKKENLKAKKKSFIQRCQEYLVAVSFAEEGEFDTARQISQPEKRGAQSEQKNRRKRNPFGEDTREEVEE